MNRRNLFATVVVCVSLVASQAAYASGAVHLHSTIKVKPVQISLHNVSAASIDLRIGDKVVTLEAGKTVSLQLPSGTRILADRATSLHEAGSVILEVTEQVNKGTLTIL